MRLQQVCQLRRNSVHAEVKHKGGEGTVHGAGSPCWGVVEEGSGGAVRWGETSKVTGSRRWLPHPFFFFFF